VVLSLSQHQPLGASDDYRILSQVAGGPWVDESVADPTLRTWVDRDSRSVFRRIKHFSGYLVAGGLLDLDGGFLRGY
jgi:hypothetical protein